MLTITSKFFFGVFIGFILGRRLLNGIIFNGRLDNTGSPNSIDDPKFSFNKMVFEIHKLLDEQKAIATSTIRNFYLRRTTPRRKTIEAIQRWIDKERKENINH